MNLPISVLDIQKFSRTSIFTVAISDILERTHRSCIDFLFSGSKLQNYDISSKCLSENVLESLWLQFFSAWCKTYLYIGLHRALKSLATCNIQLIINI